jgi:hypothetical protein
VSERYVSSSLATACMSTPTCTTETANYNSHSPTRLQWVHSHKCTKFHGTISFCSCPSTFLPSPPPVKADVFPHVPTTFPSLLWSTRLSSSSREVMEGDFQVPVFLPPYELFRYCLTLNRYISRRYTRYNSRSISGYSFLQPAEHIASKHTSCN